MRPQVIEFADACPAQVALYCIDSYPFHWHGAIEIIWVLQGEVDVEQSGQTHLLQPGDIVAINANEPHRIAKRSDENQLLVVHLDTPACEQLYPGFGGTWIHCCSVNAPPLTSAKYDQLQKQSLQLGRLLHQPQQAAAELTACLTCVLRHLATSFDFLRFGLGTKPLDEKLVHRYRAIYQQVRTLTSKQGLREPADRAEISLQHLSTDIKARFGLTFQELLSCMKCQRAVRMLLASDLPIAGIASACGFSDPKYLIRHFKRHYRTTPSQFRRLHYTGEQALPDQVRYQELPLACALLLSGATDHRCQ